MQKILMKLQKNLRINFIIGFFKERKRKNGENLRANLRVREVTPRPIRKPRPIRTPGPIRTPRPIRTPPRQLGKFAKIKVRIVGLERLVPRPINP